MCSCHQKLLFLTEENVTEVQFTDVLVDIVDNWNSK